jgi:hypothetical protein
VTRFRKEFLGESVPYGHHVSFNTNFISDGTLFLTYRDLISFFETLPRIVLPIDMKITRGVSGPLLEPLNTK